MKNYDDEINTSLEQGKTFLRAGEKRPINIDFLKLNNSKDSIEKIYFKPNLLKK
jgi:hypothetical protein